MQFNSLISTRAGLRMAMMIALMCVIGVEMTYTGTVAYYREFAPAKAVRWRSQDAGSNLKLADAEYFRDYLVAADGAGKPAIGLPETASAERPELTALRERVVAALAREPVNPRGVRLLGQMQPGDAGRPYFEQARLLSKREGVATLFLASNALLEHEYPKAADLVDAILRADPLLIPKFAPLLAQMATNEAARKSLVDILATLPPWGAAMMPMILHDMPDAKGPLQLFADLREKGVTVDRDLENQLVNTLLQKKQYESAYDSWLQLLPDQELSRVKNIYNGDFATRPRGTYFDWVVANGTNTHIWIEPAPDGSKSGALVVEYTGGPPGAHSVTENVQLSPGSYAFKGQLKGALGGTRGHRWRIYCNNTGSLTGSSDLLNSTHLDWDSFAFEFVVPQQGCVSQYVQLSLYYNNIAEAIAPGQIMYRNLSLIRKPTL